jgi:DNA-binding MarR family transcriptional regulator
MLVGVMNTLRDTTNDPELPSQMIVLILTLATRSEPPGVLELAKIIGMSQASASRCVTVLGRGLRGKPGLGLVEAVEDPTNYSRKLVRLTAKGNRLVDALETTVINAIRTLGVNHG